jgi:glycosyltransferase involved in cell wall biosynthesis
MRTHILLISNTRGSMSGADRDFVTLINSLSASDFRITWAGVYGSDCLRPYLDETIVPRIFDTNLPSFSYLIQQNAYINRSKWLWTKILIDHFYRLQSPFRKLKREFANDKVDLVISNTTAVTLGALYAKTQGLPHIWFIKECLDTNVKACQNLSKWIFRLSNEVVAASNAVAKSFSNPVRVLHDGNDLKQINKNLKNHSRNQILTNLGLPSDIPVVAQIGGLVPWKGQDITAKAFVLAAVKNAPKFSLLFLGEGSGDFKKEIENILAEAPEESRKLVRFAKFEADDWSLVNVADIVIHPSILPDPLPNAVREAMILGKFVIASDEGGIPEMIENEKTGILFEVRNVEMLAETLQKYLRNEVERNAIGKEAGKFAKNYFDINNRKLDFISLFQEFALRKNK